MNCKPGDLAIVVRGLCAKNDGKIVHVVRAAVPGELIEGIRFEPRLDSSHWLCEGRIYTRDGRGPLRRWAFMDESLRPIRDPGEDARDETLEWLPVPSVKEPA